MSRIVWKLEKCYFSEAFKVSFIIFGTGAACGHKQLKLNFHIHHLYGTWNHLTNRRIFAECSEPFQMKQNLSSSNEFHDRVYNQSIPFTKLCNHCAASFSRRFRGLQGLNNCGKSAWLAIVLYVKQTNMQHFLIIIFCILEFGIAKLLFDPVVCNANCRLWFHADIFGNRFVAKHWETI